MASFRRLFRLHLRAGTVERDIEDETAFHLDAHTADLIEEGLAPHEARQEALRRFGDLERVRRECRAIGRRQQRGRRRLELSSELRQDAAFALRQLRQAPGFALTAVVTLALGLGATSAIWSLLYGIVLSPLPFPETDRLVHLHSIDHGEVRSVSPGNFAAFREARSLERLAARTSDSLSLTGDGEPIRVSGQRVTAGYFAVLGVEPLLGRTFTADEDRPGGEPVALLSYGFWRSRFAADPKVVNRQLRLDGVPHTVIGVMPDAMRVLRGAPAVWRPLALPADGPQDYGSNYLLLVGRLRRGVALTAAQTEVETIAARLEQLSSSNAGKKAWLEPMVDGLLGGYRRRLTVLLAAVSCVLLIGCVNVANLLLARGAARTREIAVRAALGAGRWRLVRQLLTESLVLGLAATLVGLGVANLVVRGLVRLAPGSIPRLDEAGLSFPTLAFAFGLGLVASLLFGLVPALTTARADLQGMLKEGKGSTGAGAAPRWLRGGLLAGEVAVTLALLCAAGLFLQSSLRLSRTPVGFDAARLLTARVTLPKATYPEPARVADTFERIVTGLAGLPGAQAAAAVSLIPLSSYDRSSKLTLADRTLPSSERIDGSWRVVTPGYLRALRIRLLAGRDFTAHDREGTSRVAIVNQSLARLAWPGEDPLGKRFSDSGGGDDPSHWLEVVGLAADVRSGNLATASPPGFLVPLRQAAGHMWDMTGASLSFVVRAEKDPAKLASPLRRVVAEVDPDLAVYDVATMDEVRGAAIAQSRISGLLLTALGLVGLVLAVIGIYGVVSYLVNQRTQEIGLRMALGATPWRVLALVLGQASKPVAVGLALGLAGAAFLGKLLSGMLYGIEPVELGTLAALVALLLAAALLAGYLPARRATGVDPSRALSP